MTRASTDVLRRSLDQVDRERKRTNVLLYSLLGMTVAFWLAMIFAKDDHTGLLFGLAAVIGGAFVAGMIAAKASHDNTRAILKAIEFLSKEEPAALATLAPARRRPSCKAGAMARPFGNRAVPLEVRFSLFRHSGWINIE